MVSLDDLVALVTSGAPVDTHGNVSSAPPPPPAPQSPTAMDSKEEEKLAESGDSSRLTSHSGSPPEVSWAAAAAARHAVVEEKKKAVMMRGTGAKIQPGQRVTPALFKEPREVNDRSAAAAARVGGEGYADPGAAPAGLRRPSSWFRDQRQGSMSWLDGAGVGGVEVMRPLPANVRWAFMCLLDSLFFSVKEPIEGLDRHPAVQALLENVLAVSSPLVVGDLGGGRADGRTDGRGGQIDCYRRMSVGRMPVWRSLRL